MVMTTTSVRKRERGRFFNFLTVNFLTPLFNRSAGAVPPPPPASPSKLRAVRRNSYCRWERAASVGCGYRKSFLLLEVQVMSGTE